MTIEEANAWCARRFAIPRIHEGHHGVIQESLYEPGHAIDISFVAFDGAPTYAVPCQFLEPEAFT